MDRRLVVLRDARHCDVRSPISGCHDGRMGEKPWLVENVYRLWPVDSFDRHGDILAGGRKSR